MTSSPAPSLNALHTPALGLLLILATGHFGAVVVRGLPGVVAVDLQTRFGLDDTAFGLLHGPAYVTIHVVGMVVAAAVIDRLDRFRTMAVCIVVWTMGSLVFALADSLTGLVVGRVAVGLGQAAFAPCAASLIIDRSGRGFSRPLSFLTAGSALGRSAGIMLTGLLIAFLAMPEIAARLPMADWRMASIIVTLPFLALAVWLMRFRDDRPSPASDASRGLRSNLVWCWGLRSVLGPHLIVAATVILLGHATTAWMPSVFQRLFELAPGPAAVMAGTTILIGAPIGHFAGGVVLDRWMAAGRSPIEMIALSQMWSAACGLGLGFSADPVSAWLAGAGVALGLGVGSLAALAAFQPITPSHRRAAVTALFFAGVTLLGMGLGPPLVGLVSDRAFGAGEGLGPAIALVIVVVALAGAILAWLVTPRWRVLERQGPSHG